MLGWEGEITDCDVGTVETFEPFMLDSPEALEAMSNPWTFNAINCPTLVMLGCAACVTTLAWGTLPCMLLPCKAERADPFETMFPMVACPRT
jgi:hypothetical protein